MSADPRDLTGCWSGIFNYPRDMPPTGFDLELREAQGVITGETSEQDDSGLGNGIIHALIDGRRSGASVDFVKRYDDLRRAENPVHYHGTINTDGTEITGRWTIPGHWSGSFIMVRQSGKAEEVEQQISETADL